MFSKTKRLVKSQKGDAIILVSVLVSGIVLLVVALMVEKSGKFTQTQDLSRKSIESSYKAEEGLEYILYTTKEGILNQNNKKEFTLTGIKYDSNNIKKQTLTTTDETILEAATILPADKLIVISKSDDLEEENTNVNSTAGKNLFSNLPKSFYNQVFAWQSTSGCYNGDFFECAEQIVDKQNSASHNYQMIVPLSPISGDWTNVKYKFVFKCSSKSNTACAVSSVKVRTLLDPPPEGCLNYPQKCEMVSSNSGKDSFNSNSEGANCLSEPVEINLDNNGTGSSNKLIYTEWFNPANSANILGDINGKNMVLEFTANDGEDGVEETILPQDDEGITLCKDKEEHRNMRAGLFKVVVKKVNQ